MRTIIRTLKTRHLSCVGRIIRHQHSFIVKMSVALHAVSSFFFRSHHYPDLSSQPLSFLFFALFYELSSRFVVSSSAPSLKQQNDHHYLAIMMIVISFYV